MAVALWYTPRRNSKLYQQLKTVMLSLQTLFPDAPKLLIPHITITSNLDESKVNDILNTSYIAFNSIKGKFRSEDGTNMNTTDDNAGIDRDNIESINFIEFDKISVGSKYFQKIRMDCIKNKYLFSIVQIIREMYLEKEQTNGENNMETNSDWVIENYQPHLSLVYSDMYPVSKALLLNIYQRLQDALDIEININTGEILHSGSDNDFIFGSYGWNYPGSFMVVKCVGPVDGWKILGSIDV
ncbi:related to 2',3'-cyclic-nucleotide 3'-phosphodiesterase [Saccharomycodes ludwigii]|uniref:2',3'-cyclic-nucleotide 3'-phosphodiesterase n=1 Tax=Saccharomycodes ludwigii TaxID=36035 RepID=A0A376BAB9_9ASCO|nr:hypothetical protein SCDLUD_004807 [Saccharomycodes ludwigii]KAH3899366.1 hypothetical protein SCDLUD_004807 [Saccharomycodes ludwigii]SSD61070.1 related to 2',3'-cyclic-nucleotide 3'-phosphodiesterase [Saccharomycodes ludwigii]